MNKFNYVPEKQNWKLSTSVFANKLRMVNEKKKFEFAYQNDMAMIEKRLPKEIGYNADFERDIKTA